MGAAEMKKLRMARTKLAFVRHYFERAIYGLVLVEAPDCPTMATDVHKRLYFNPDFVRAHTIAQLATVYLHEVGHPLRDHHERARRMGVSRRTAHLANIAMDIPINELIRSEQVSHPDDELPPLPESTDPEVLALPRKLRGPWFADQFDMPTGLTWEAYYKELLSRAGLSGIGGGHDCGSGAHGVVAPWELGAPDDCGVEGVSDADWTDIQHLTARRIAEHSQRFGTDALGGWHEWAYALLRPKPIPWDRLLGARVRGTIASRRGAKHYTYSWPSRMQQSVPDAVLPAMRSPQPRVVLVGDTSASMDIGHDLALVRGVVSDICRQLGARLTFLSTDTAVHGGAQRVSGGEAVQLIGRGGTNMGAGLEAAAELRPRPNLTVVATDCGTEWPDAAPRGVPVIVCAIGATEEHLAKVPSWATVIKVEKAS